MTHIGPRPLPLHTDGDSVVVTIYPGDVPLMGDNAPSAYQIDDLLRLLATIRHRWGNTAVKYRIQWGANALWAEDEQNQRIAKLEAKVRRLQNKIKASGRA